MASWLKLLLSANASEVTIVQQNPLRLEFRGRSDMLVKAQMQKVTVRTLFSGCDRGKYSCRWVGNSSTLLRPNFAWASAGSVASPRPALRRFFLYLQLTCRGLKAKLLPPPEQTGESEVFADEAQRAFD